MFKGAIPPNKARRGRRKMESKSSKTSTRRVIIFVVLLVVVGLGAWVGYQVWESNQYVDISQRVSIGLTTSFPTDYIEQNRGKVIIEVPEVYELINIITAISKPGQEGSISLNRQSSYYQKVMDSFLQFKDHPAVARVVETLDQHSYSTLRLLFAYKFDGDKLVHGGIYQQIHLEELGQEHLSLLEDFAQKSGFREFYQENLPYYQEKIESFQETVPMERIWDWLENNFPVRHDTYKVVLSPLVYGSHNTWDFVDREHDYSEIVMYVSTPELFDRYDLSPAVREALVSRMVFTEIDHNYVNPATNEADNLKMVIRAFANLAKWNKQGGYSKPALTFNEYMTWGTACLYAYDNYQPEDYQVFLQSTINTMNYRGFILFDMFYARLLELYQGRKDGDTVYDLYPEILEWSRKI